MIALRMRSFDVRVERAFFGTQGLCSAVQDQPDLIIMDLAMPHGDGQYVLEHLKRNRQTRDIPVIVLTGKRDQQLSQQLLRSGAAQYLRKPVLVDELVREIGRFVELRERGSD
jgi:CheY-like chemotaxis protein